MNDFVLNLIDKRNAMKQDCDVYPSVEKMQEYRKFKNYVKNQIFKAKRLYFKSNFENVADSKNIWRTYDELTGKNIKQSFDIPVLDNGSTLVNDNVQKANIFSECFLMKDNVSNIDKNSLLNNIMLQKSICNDEEITFNTTDISDASKKMKWKPSPSDKIPMIALKYLLPHILLPISILFTCFSLAGEFPSEFKKAIVVPLYKKKGKQSDPNNFRPISMLSNFSKLFEYCVNKKLTNHLENSNMLDEKQHGFRSGRSCATALTIFTNNIFKELDSPNNTIIVVYFDLKSAFVSVVHSLLINDLLTIFKVNINLVI
jgi:hypothetical protein